MATLKSDTDGLATLKSDTDGLATLKKDAMLIYLFILQLSCAALRVLLYRGVKDTETPDFLVLARVSKPMPSNIRFSKPSGLTIGFDHRFLTIGNHRIRI